MADNLELKLKHANTRFTCVKKEDINFNSNSNLKL